MKADLNGLLLCYDKFSKKDTCDMENARKLITGTAKGNKVT